MDTFEPNPFVHRIELTTREKIKTLVFSVLLLPIRVVMICGLLVFSWCLASIALYGFDEGRLKQEPITGWRNKIKTFGRIIMRWVVFALGFNRINIVGRQEGRAVAPILIVAPHTSWLDTIAPFMMVPIPSLVSRVENRKIPLLGKLIDFTQPVYVRREDAGSRQRTIQDIRDRATSPMSWPQIVVFPEGTCTNRKSLIQFKVGAFYPGLPVQPVLIQYPNEIDTVTWTWDGPGSWKLLWLTLTRWKSNCCVEFLPVYYPSEEEKNNPRLYADNVRIVMAEALGIPTSSYNYEDAKIVGKANKLQLEFDSVIIRTLLLRNRLGLAFSKVEEEILNRQSCLDENVWISKSDFAKELRLSEEMGGSIYFDQLVNLYARNSIQNENNEGSQDGPMMVNFKKYLLAVILGTRCNSKNEMMKTIDNLFGHEIDKTWFVWSIQLMYSMTESEVERLYLKLLESGTEERVIDFDKMKALIESWKKEKSEEKLEEKKTN